MLRSSGVEIAAETGDAEDLLRKVRAHRPDVVIVDIRMPPHLGDDGLRAARMIRSGDPDVAVLVLSQFLDERYAVELLDDRPEGVGYLLKDRIAEAASFVEAVRRVARGESVIDSEVIGRLVGHRGDVDPLQGLTTRNREVLMLMAQGRSNLAIADELFVTVSAVERHVSSIFSTLNLQRDALEHRRVTAVLHYLQCR